MALWNSVKKIWFSELYIMRIEDHAHFSKNVFLTLLHGSSWGLYYIWYICIRKTGLEQENWISSKRKKGPTREKKNISQWNRRETALHCLIDWSPNKCISIYYIASSCVKIKQCHRLMRVIRKERKVPGQHSSDTMTSIKLHYTKWKTLASRPTKASSLKFCGRAIKSLCIYIKWYSPKCRISFDWYSCFE